MKIKKLCVADKYADFGKNTLVTSYKNSSGKTTFIRLLLHSFGWEIPSTRGINFKNLRTELVLENFGNDFKIVRRENSVTIWKNNKLLDEYDSQNERNSILSVITGITQHQLLDNLLGLMYFDQEKGWTLLNRGVVIGSNRFNIERLLEGFSERNFEDINEKLKNLKNQINGYRNILTALQYQDEIRDNNDNFDWTYPDQLDEKLRLANMDISAIRAQIKSLTAAKTENNRFKKMISGFGLRINTPSGEEVIVTEKNIVGFDETQSFIDARLSILSREQSKLLSEKSKIQTSIQEHMSLFETESQLQVFNNLIANMNLSSPAIEKIIGELKLKEKKLQKELTEELNNSNYSKLVYQETMKFSEFLGVDKYLSNTLAVIKLSELRRYSGAVLHLLVFAFRMADLKVFQEKTSCVLPIIIDSPFGKEISKENVSLIYQLLKKYFPKNQIITASIENIGEITSVDKTYVFGNDMLTSLD